MKQLASKLLAKVKNWLKPPAPPVVKHYPDDALRQRSRRTPGAFGTRRSQIRLLRAVGIGTYSERDELVAQLLEGGVRNARAEAQRLLDHP